MSTIRIAKTEVLQLLSLASVGDLNAKLLELSESLQQQKKRVPDELVNPDKYDTLTQKSLGLLRDFLKPSENLALPAFEDIQGESVVSEGESVVSDSTSESQPLTQGTGGDLATTDDGVGGEIDTPPNDSSIAPSTEFIPQVSIGVRETLISATQQVNTLAGIELADSAFSALKTGFFARTEAYLNTTLNGLESELEQSLQRIQSGQKVQKQSESDSLGKLNTATQQRLDKMNSLFAQLDISKV